jgi:hypothetical protein
MNKSDIINELTNLLAIALRHKIGSIVNDKEIYAQKYSKDAEILLKETEKISLKLNWNPDDKTKIKEILKRKLKEELEKKDFLSDKKFSLMDEEIENALVLLRLK